MTEDDSRLDELFRTYRVSCPDVEPSAQFMPGLWQKIEARRGVSFTFRRLARTAMTACAALCLVLLVLNFVSTPQSHLSAATYADALLADRSPDDTDYTEMVQSTPPNGGVPEQVHH